VLRDGWRIAADAVISRCRPRPPAAWCPATSCPRPRLSPIVAAPLTDADVSVGAPPPGRHSSDYRDAPQWLFDCGPSRAGGTRLATVTSGARAWDDADDARIVAETVADLRRTLPALRDFRPTRAHVVRERHATLSLTPDVERTRPDTTTAVENLFLAGDWVRTGLPATIEGAVVSGRRAADLVLAAAIERPAAAA
jgi:hypothetical protein